MRHTIVPYSFHKIPFENKTKKYYNDYNVHGIIYTYCISRNRFTIWRILKNTLNRDLAANRLFLF